MCGNYLINLCVWNDLINLCALERSNCLVCGNDLINKSSLALTSIIAQPTLLVLRRERSAQFKDKISEGLAIEFRTVNSAVP